MSSCTTANNPLSYDYYSSCFSNTYSEARHQFLEKSRDVASIKSFEIDVRGPSGEKLVTDIAVVGDLKTAKNILIHFSGTHGVEGFAGSAIQKDFFENLPEFPEGVAMVFVHALNPYGFAYNRRVDENGCDDNRTCLGEGVPVPHNHAYDQIAHFFRLNEGEQFDFDELSKFCTENQINILQATEGQYHDPEGVFYGGSGPSQLQAEVIRWFEETLTGLKRDLSDLSIGIIDVHTGLGSKGDDTLLTVGMPTDKMMRIFRDKMSLSKRTATAGYLPKGIFIAHLSEVLQRVTQCAKEKIFFMAQEFGTVPIPKVLTALVVENVQYQRAKKAEVPYDPFSEGGMALREAFYPQDEEWKKSVIENGRELIQNSFRMFDPALDGKGAE